jgi:type IV pilus assembly protein PilV
MRANRLGITAGNYDSISGADSDPVCITTGCTPAQMAQYDSWAWNSANAALLPSGSGSVTTDGTTYTITVTWDDDRDGAADNNFVFQLQP